MKLNYFQLTIVWLLIGIFGKIYDDAIDIYYIKHGTFFIELIKLILTSLGLIILFNAPDIYTPLIIFSLFCFGSLLDYDAFLNDSYWCAISVLVPVYTAFYIHSNFKQLKLKDIFIIFLFFNISGIPMMQSCVTLNGPVVDYVNTHFFNISWIIQFFDQTEISKRKLLFRFINVIWDVILILYLEKYLFKCFNIQNDNLFNICKSLTYYMFGYYFISVINLSYNLYIDNIYERRKARADRQKAKNERRKARRKLKAESREKKLIALLTS